jgi:hypothetical protein
MRFLVLTFLYALSAFGAAEAAGQEMGWRQLAQDRFRDVLFSREEVMAHAERSYHP